MGDIGHIVCELFLNIIINILLWVIYRRVAIFVKNIIFDDGMIDIDWVQIYRVRKYFVFDYSIFGLFISMAPLPSSTLPSFNNTISIIIISHIILLFCPQLNNNIK